MSYTNSVVRFRGFTCRQLRLDYAWVLDHRALEFTIQKQAKPIRAERVNG